MLKHIATVQIQCKWAFGKGATLNLSNNIDGNGPRYEAERFILGCIGFQSNIFNKAE